MKRSKFSEVRVALMLSQAERGVRVGEVRRSFWDFIVRSPSSQTVPRRVGA